MSGTPVVGDLRDCPTAQPVSVGAVASTGKQGVKARQRGALGEGWGKVGVEGRFGSTVQQENHLPGSGEPPVSGDIQVDTQAKIWKD